MPDVAINFENLDGSVDKSSIQQLYIEETEFNVTIPENKSKKEGYRFKGWLCQEDGKVYAVGEIATFSWETYGGKSIILTAQWVWDEYNIFEAGEYTLSAGKSYCFGEGTWIVTGDDYSYAGGSKENKTATKMLIILGSIILVRYLVLNNHSYIHAY